MNPEYIRICSIPAMQEKFRERMGEPKWGDLVIIPGKPGKALCPEDFHLHEFWKDTSKDWTFCPLPIDPLNPERGLWGMLSKECSYQLTWREKYLLNVWRGSQQERCIDADTPELALIRALCHQWGIETEVKG